jgi:hypothetical protein
VCAVRGEVRTLVELLALLVNVLERSQSLAVRGIGGRTVTVNTLVKRMFSESAMVSVSRGVEDEVMQTG